MVKVDNRNSKKRSEICLKLTINTPVRRHWPRSGVFIVNLNIYYIFFKCPYC